MPPDRTSSPSTGSAPAIRAALPGDCDDVARMASELALATAPGVHPKVTGDALRANLFGPAPLLRLVVAERDGALCGYCLSLLMFSTWHGARGVHVIDLYVRPGLRGGKVGEQMLAAAARSGWRDGARFIRLEVERGNADAERFYARLGFVRKDNELHYTIADEPMRLLTERAGPTTGD
jgi:ribosomal protein S18 acetylase RimI-like enzyme